MKYGKRIQDTSSVNLLADSKGAKELVDNDLNTYVAVPAGEKGTVFSLKEPVTIDNRVVIEGNVGEYSEPGRTCRRCIGRRTVERDRQSYQHRLQTYSPLPMLRPTKYVYASCSHV